MAEPASLDRIAINVKAYKLLEQLLGENPRLEEIMRGSKNEVEALVGVRKWVLGELESRPAALKVREGPHPDREDFEALGWSDIAAIRLLDYVEIGFSHLVQTIRGLRELDGVVNILALAGYLVGHHC